MCLLIFAHQVCPAYPLVIGANRDEFHARETAVSAFWPEHPNMLAGRDLQAGGTWMGITKEGRFAALTNYRDPAATLPAGRSRGELAVNFLQAELTPNDYLHDLSTRAQHYAGFNLLLGDGHDLWHFSNRPVAADNLVRPPHLLRPGIYGLSNASLNTPWPKVELGKQRLVPLLERTPLTHDALLGVVNDRRQASLDALSLQGMETEMEQQLSAQFIQTALYGTRSSTTMWLDDKRTICWREISFNPQGEILTTHETSFACCQTTR